MQEKEYRAIVEECVEFGWLNHYQDSEFREIEKSILLPGLHQLEAAHQVLAALFLQHEFLEPGVALAAASFEPPPSSVAGELHPAAERAFAAAEAERGQMLLATGPDALQRDQFSQAVAQHAEARGFQVQRIRGRRREDGRLEPVVETLVTEGLLGLPEAERRDFCIRQGQYLQMMAPLENFPVRPGGVFNTDPGMNRLKLNKGILELLLKRLGRGPLCLLAEEVHLYPRLGLETLSYLAWILKNGTMGLSGLDDADRTLDTRPFLLVMTGEPVSEPFREAWLHKLEQRRVNRVELD